MFKQLNTYKKIGHPYRVPYLPDVTRDLAYLYSAMMPGTMSGVRRP